MGVSDQHYFAWLSSALQRFERATGELAAIGARSGRPELWVLAGARLNEPAERAREALGGSRVTVRLFDKFADDPGVERLDFNDLEAAPEDACDVLMMSRASYMIEDPAAFLRHTRRMLRPGGLLVIDWLHGSSEAPALDLPGHHEYDGRVCTFHTTYCDGETLTDCAAAFEALIRHVNRPPAWVNVARPGQRVPVGARLRRLVSGTSPRNLTRATYLDTLRDDLGRAGKHLVEAEVLGSHFKVLFRDACYLYPAVKKFHLYVLTVLMPAGK